LVRKSDGHRDDRARPADARAECVSAARDESRAGDAWMHGHDSAFVLVLVPVLVPVPVDEARPQGGTVRVTDHRRRGTLVVRPDRAAGRGAAAWVICRWANC
jgi:hypothetical protein